MMIPTLRYDRLRQGLFSKARALLAVFALATLAVPYRASAQSTQTLTILGGSGSVGSVAANVEYYNSTTGLWQPTYLTGGHPWGFVPGTNSWINYKTSNASDAGISNVRLNPTWYLYRVRFTVPSDAQNPQMTFSIRADNWAQVSINGVSTAPSTATPPWAAVTDHGVPIGLALEGGPSPVNINADAVFSQNVHTGENTITINVGDYGGLNGFNFRIDLSMQSSQPLALVAAGTPAITVSPPVISVPADITVNATSAAGATVNFSTSATSNVRMEIFRRTTVEGEQWKSYTTTFTSARTGNFTLGFNVVSATGGDNSIFIDAVKVTGTPTTFTDGFEQPTLAANTGADAGNTTLPVALGSNWYFTNFGGIVNGDPQVWGPIPPPPEGSQFAVLRDVASKQSQMTSAGQISLVAGQVYTVTFYQASRNDGAFSGALTYTVTLDSVESVPVTATPHVSGDTFPIGTTTELLTAVNSAAGISTASFNVTVNTLPVTFTLNNLTQTYDGTAKSITATSNPANVAYVINYLGDNTNAGSCPVQVLSANPIYSGSKNDTLVINKASSTTVVTINGGPFTYNGSAQTPASVAVTGAGGLSLTPTASYANNTNAGTATASYTYAGDKNHTGSSDSKDFTIDKAPSTTTTVGAGPFTYDGTTQAGGSGTVTGVNLSTSATSLTYAGDQVNASSYTVTAHYAGDANHAPSDGTPVSVTINQAASTTTTVGAGPFTYDGTTHNGGSGTVTGAGVLTGTATATYSGDQVNAGSYSVTAHYAGDANHAPSDGAPVSITINQAASTTTTVGAGPFTYNGTTQGGGSGTITGAGVITGTATVTYAGDQINAGSYTVTAHYVGDANHTPSDGAAVAITVNKASSSTTTAGAGPFIYDGTTHAGGSGTVTGAGSLSASATSVTYSGDQVNAGSYTVTAHYAGDANHTASDGAAVAITIGKATATVVPAPYTLTYDGSPHTAGFAITGVHGETGATVGTVTQNTTHTDVGIYADTWSFTGARNYGNIAATPITNTIKGAATASLVPVRGGGDDESTQSFTVVFSATDTVGVKTLTASLNGVTVTNGQVVQLQTIKSGAQSVKRDDGKLQIKATSFTLTVVATYTNGGTATATAVPVFNKNGQDSEDKGNGGQSDNSGKSSTDDNNNNNSGSDGKGGKG